MRRGRRVFLLRSLSGAGVQRRSKQVAQTPWMIGEHVGYTMIKRSINMFERSIYQLPTRVDRLTTHGSGVHNLLVEYLV